MNRRDKKAAFMQEAEEMYEELSEWRERNPEATFDEIATQVTRRRRELMGSLLEQLATQNGDGRYAEVRCPTCGEVMTAKGRRKRTIVHSEGELELERAYHHCAECNRGLFPPGPAAEPDTIWMDAGNNRVGD